VTGAVSFILLRKLYMAVPFRLQPYALSADELSRHNAERARHGLEPFAPADVLLPSLAKPSDAKLRLPLIGHPDERVRIAALRYLDPRHAPAHDLRGVLEASRADARGHGHLWNPTFDVCERFVNSVWGTRKKDQEAYEGIGAWAAAETDPAALLSILDFSTWDVHRAAAKRMTLLSDEVLSAFVAKPHCPRFVAENPNLGSEHVRLLGTWACDVFLHRARRRGTPAPATLDLNGASTLLTYMQKAGQALPERVVRDLLEAIEGGEMQRVYRMVGSLLAGAQRTPEEIGRALHRLGPYSTMHEYFLRHPAITAEHAFYIFHGTDKAADRRAVAALPLARTDAMLRSAVLGDSAVTVVSAYFEGASPEEYVQGIEELIDRDSKHVGEVLQRVPPPEGLTLPQSVLGRILSSARAEVRLTGIRLSGGAAGARGPGEAQASPSRGAR
jgi:hypothetical protein